MINERERLQEILESGFYTVKHEQAIGVNTNTDKVELIATEDGEKATNTNTRTYYTEGVSDIKLLVKHYSNEGLKPKEIKERIIKLWHNYDSFSDYRKLNSVILSVRRKGEVLQDLPEIKVSEEALNWFLGLNKEIKGVNWPRTKYLFTLYVWNKVNENKCGKKCDTVFMASRHKQFKKDAALSSNFSVTKENREFYKMGLMAYPMPYEILNNDWLMEGSPSAQNMYRKVLHSDPYKLLFLDRVPAGEETIKVDVLNPGKWLTDKKKENKVVVAKEAKKNLCPICGKEFEKKSNNPNECCEDCKRTKNREKMRRYRNAR